MSHAAISVRKLFDFVVAKGLPAVGGRTFAAGAEAEAFAALVEEANSADGKGDDVDDEVFVQTWIPSNLTQVGEDRRSLEREFERRQRGEDVLYERLLADPRRESNERENDEECEEISAAQDIVETPATEPAADATRSNKGD